MFSQLFWECGSQSSQVNRWLTGFAFGKILVSLFVGLAFYSLLDLNAKDFLSVLSSGFTFHTFLLNHRATKFPFGF